MLSCGGLEELREMSASGVKAVHKLAVGPSLGVVPLPDLVENLECN